MKFLFLAACFFLSIVPSETDTEKIAWSKDRQLTWEDFKGTPKGWDDYVASTNSGISFSYSYGVENRQLELSYKVKSNFYPNLSWFVPGHVDTYILKHEQTHFDISELHARKLRKRLAEAEFSLFPKEKLDGFYSDTEQERRAMQAKYDAESDHSKVKEAELEWRLYVAQQLREYERWK